MRFTHRTNRGGPNPLIAAGASYSITGGAATLNYTPAAGGYWTGTVRATDGTQADVQAKINAASDGDIITIPSGSFTWTSNVSCSKGVLIRGAGGGRIEGASRSSVAIGTGSKTFTLLTFTGGRNSWFSGFTNGETIRARAKHDGTWMEGTVTSWTPGTATLVLNITSTSGTGTKGFWTFEQRGATQITHNAGTSTLITLTESTVQHVGLNGIHFIKGTGSGYAVEGNGTTGKVPLIWGCRSSEIHQGFRMNTNRGVFWNTYFDGGFNIGAAPNNNNNGIQATNPSGTGGANWNQANTMGTSDTNGTANIYIENCYFCGLVLGCVDLGDYCRGVMRNCILDNSGATTHGFDTDPIGVRHTEFYDNTCFWDDAGAASANLNYLMAMRGGSGIFTGNYSDAFTTPGTYGVKNQISLEVQQIRRGGTICATAYPATRQTGQGHNGTSFITEGVYVFSNDGTFSQAGTQYEPDECGNGQTIGTYMQLNRDFFNRAPTTGEPLNGWTRYTYPHPLRSGV